MVRKRGCLSTIALYDRGEIEDFATEIEETADGVVATVVEVELFPASVSGLVLSAATNERTFCKTSALDMHFSDIVSSRIHSSSICLRFSASLMSISAPPSLKIDPTNGTGNNGYGNAVLKNKVVPNGNECLNSSKSRYVFSHIQSAVCVITRQR